jgi:hypothetical protein
MSIPGAPRRPFFSVRLKIFRQIRKHDIEGYRRVPQGRRSSYRPAEFGFGDFAWSLDQSGAKFRIGKSFGSELRVDVATLEFRFFHLKVAQSDLSDGSCAASQKSRARQRGPPFGEATEPGDSRRSCAIVIQLIILRTDPKEHTHNYDKQDKLARRRTS